MDRETLGTYGFVVLSVILFSLLLAAVIPIGVDSKEKAEENVDMVMTEVKDYKDKGIYEADKYYTVTVNYSFSDGAKRLPPYSVLVRSGEYFDIKVKDYEGYIANLYSISALADSDKTFNVVYTKL